jgi:hypothetical protein
VALPKRLPGSTAPPSGPSTEYWLSFRQLKRLEPCLPRPAKQPPAGAGWIHEIKHNGFRILAERDGG